MDIPEQDHGLKGIRDPFQHGAEVNKRIFGAHFGLFFPDPTNPYFTDAPVIATYEQARGIKSDGSYGTGLANDTVGCPLACAHCWVANGALGGALTSKFLQARLRSLPQNKFIYDAQEVFERNMSARANSRTRDYKGFALTGGEPTVWRGGVKNLAQLAQAEGMYLDIDTMGLMIARIPGYLDAWEGLQDTLRFYVSIKHVTPLEYERFTKRTGEHKDDAFIAIRALLERGFPVEPGGVVLNIFYSKKDAQFEKELGLPPETLVRLRMEKLHGELAAIHPDLPRLVSRHKITFGYVHVPQEQMVMMRQRGYIKTYPAITDRHLHEVFSERGTPIINSNYERPHIVHEQWGEVQRAIIKDMSGRDARTVYPCSVMKKETLTLAVESSRPSPACG